jgi:flagellar hook-length control protein FliK
MNDFDNFYTQQERQYNPQSYKPQADRADPTTYEDDRDDRNDRIRSGADIQANFLDFVLAQTNGQEITQDNKAIITTPTIDVVRETPKVDVAAVIAENPEIEAEILQFIESTELGGDVALSETLALNKIALDNILKQAGIDGDSLIIEGGEIPEELSALLNLNLTPAQLAALQEASKGGEANEALDAILSGLVTIVTPQEQNTLNAALAAQLAAEEARIAAAAAAQAQAQATGVAAPLNNKTDIAPSAQLETARVNSLNVGWGENGAQEEQILKYLSSNFKAALKDALEQNIQGSAKDGAGPASIASATAANAQNANGASGSTLQGWPFTLDGSLLAPQDGGQLFAQELGQVAAGTPNATQMAGLTSLIGQAQGATHAHPASQMVAVNMQKSAGKGGDTQITIQLDPPELGRVEVRMHFSKDKSVKTTLMIEKPETHTMMQRDAQMLERVMQDMGLDTEGGINFELAEQGFDFDQDNQRGGGHDKGGTGAGGENGEELDLIETTMTWQVDAESGHMRYNIWA